MCSERSDDERSRSTVNGVACRRRRRSLAALLWITCAAGTAMLACRKSTPLEQLVRSARPTGVKVLIVGIDGLSWNVLDPLLAAGELPHFRRLIDDGAHGPLRSLKPMRSPSLWTTVATGKLPKDHGIVDFVHKWWEDGKKHRVLMTSGDRKVLALWNILGPFGMSVGFDGWWTTWPAEPVRGWMLSDRMTRTRWTEWSEGNADTAQAYPQELAQELRPLVVDPMHPPIEELQALAQFTPAEMDEMLAAKVPIYAHGLSVLKFGYCTQRSYEHFADAMLRRGQPDLTGVFLIANDPASHTFWHYYQPDKFHGVDRTTAHRLGTVIPNMSRHNDAELGRLLEMIDPRTVVMIISDHGFRASGTVPHLQSASDFKQWFSNELLKSKTNETVAIGQSGHHSIDGVFIAAGGPLKRGVTVKASLLDIAPTALALMGLPVPEDMPGKVLVDLIRSEFLNQHPVRKIPSYEGLIPLVHVRPGANPDDEQSLQMLRSLGYVN